MTPSHARGPDTPPLSDQTIGQLLTDTAARLPDAPALIVRHQNIRWSYAELDARVDALARGFVAAGLKPGERIGIWAPNCAEWALTQFASARAGLILVNINPAYRSAELEYALAKVGCAALVTATRFKSSDYLAILREVRPRLPALRLVATIGDDRHPGCVPFPILAGGADAVLPGGIEQDQPVNIQFTSGTTGFPKGATLSHRNIVNNGLMVGQRIGLSPADRVCIPVPLYHCFGMVMGNLACVAHGATMVYPAEGFDPAATLACVAEEGCTALYGVPTMFVAMLGEADFAGYDLHSLRTGIMAGSPCPIAVMREVIGRMNMAQVTIAYGMTETSPVSAQSAMDDPIELRVSTVGQVQPHLEVKLVDEAGGTVPVGEPGEFCTRGYSVMLGYWDDPDQTAAVLDAEGWMHTGDLAVMDGHGYLSIVGRIKDMVIRGGENIYPREIEEHLLTHPAIADAQVIGVPDDRFGEELCAWVIVRAGHALAEEAVREHCRGRIAHYKVPRYVRLVESFPLTVTGKVQKFAMREIMIAELRGA
jgi:fatty-acyl-CoA synthase